MGTAIHLRHPPISAFLVGWGRAGDGWWACITWHQAVSADGAVSDIACAAWVPADRIQRPSWAGVEDLPRVHLPPDPKLWPAPPGAPCWYVGAWIEGPPPAPAGLELVTGASWRRKSSAS